MNYLDSKLHHLEQYRHYRYPALDDQSASSPAYGFMLPRHKGALNFLEPYREQLIDSSWMRSLPEREKRNLSSSLVMLVNFLYPLCAEEKLTTFLKVLGYKYNRPDLVKARFMPQMNKPSFYSGPVRFDAVLQVRKNKSLYVKAFYTERGFSSGMTNPISEFEFMELLLPKLKMLKPAYRNYQFYLDNSELLHYFMNVEKGSDLLFLLPVENKNLWAELNRISPGLDNEYLDQHLLIWSWEEVIANLLNEPISVMHALQYEELLKKYDLVLWD